MIFDTLPLQLSPALLEFCRSLSNVPPTFIESRPAPDAQLSYCFDNAAREAARSGGSVAFGWAVWHMPGAYFEAEHHGVWRTPSGTLLDVSPQYNGYAQILFLPDEHAVYGPGSYRCNVVAPDGADPRSLTASALMTERYALLNGCRIGGLIDVDPVTRIRTDDLCNHIQSILIDIHTTPFA